MANGVMDKLFGPLDKKYCLLFYWLSVGTFFMLVLFLLLALYVGISKKLGVSFYLKMVWILIIYGVVYLQNRLLYSMCSGSV